MSPLTPIIDRQRVIEKLQELEVNGKRYRIGRELGRGGNGVAFLCLSPDKEQIVVKIYVPPDSRDLDEKALERFENEMALTKKLKHPNIVPSLGSGAVTVGAYRLPFYLMPQAAGTLRNEIRIDNDPVQIEKKLRLFLRAAYGVACLHSHGIIHRDLKPENILMAKNGTPWIADLGIAHVNPDFVSVGLKTIESERLLNRDYYAPEQRFGKATEVDQRADIYALGCIFYEMLTSIPPVRTNAPKLSVISSAYKPFEPIWERMTAWDAVNRYQVLEDALEDFSVVLGWVLATLSGAAGLQHPDIPTMVKFFKTSNEAQRQRGIEIAIRLGKSSLPELHNLLGHSRRDIRNSAAIAIGEIRDRSSIPYLLGGLYGSSNRISAFRPNVDIAAQMLALFGPQERLDALKALRYPVRPNQIQTIIAGIPSSEAYEVALALREKGLILVDWAESDLSIFLSIDENRAWPEVKALVGQREDFKLQNLFRRLSSEKRLELLSDLTEQGVDYGWNYNWILDGILQLNPDLIKRAFLLEELQSKVFRLPNNTKEREQLLQKIRASR